MLSAAKHLDAQRERPFALAQGDRALLLPRTHIRPVQTAHSYNQKHVYNKSIAVLKEYREK
jgi:hypothetical protein